MPILHRSRTASGGNPNVVQRRKASRRSGGAFFEIDMRERWASAWNRGSDGDTVADLQPGDVHICDIATLAQIEQIGNDDCHVNGIFLR